MDQVLTTAFIIAVTAFFKEQFGFSGKAALACAFLTALALSFSPLFAAQFPAIGPWIDALIKTIVLFLSAAGGYDALMQFRKRGVRRPLSLMVKSPEPK